MATAAQLDVVDLHMIGPSYYDRFQVTFGTNTLYDTQIAPIHKTSSGSSWRHKQ